MRRFTTLLLCGLVAGNVFAAEPEQKTPVPTPVLITGRYTNSVPEPTVLIDGPNDTNIVRLVAAILERQHYAQLKFDDSMSSRFLDRFLDSFDNLHLYFIQSDLDEFERFRERLDNLTKAGDVTPARVIFNRFRLRLAQQYDYVQELLKNEKFEFKGDDRFLLDRKKAPRPRDLAEAKKLWRDRLRYEYLQEKLNKEKPEDIVKNLTKRYTRVLRMLNEYDNDDVLQVYLTALARVYDPHSEYMGKSESENFTMHMKLSLFGIGAMLQSEDGICKIKQLTPGGPAERSKKFKVDDRIVAVAQSNQPPVDVVDMKLNKVVELIRGPKDTEVRLTVIPVDATDPSVRKVISIIRDEIKLEDSAAKAKIFEMPLTGKSNGKAETIRLGVIDLPSFYSGDMDGRGNGEQKSPTVDVAKLLKKLMQENVAGVILDLRRNGGGSLPEAISLTGLFIKEGPIVQERSPDGKVFVDSDPDPTVFYDGPLIVLTSRFSASASEILAGALQDYDRALIVGDSVTHGKGTVQSLQQLQPIMRSYGLNPTKNPGSAKFTVRKFYRASGASTQLKGVAPDLVLPSVANLYEVGESSLENPLIWDTIMPAIYDRVNRVEPYVAELKKRSDQRLAKDADFAYIRGEMGRYQKIQAEKSVSLNEEVRLKEKKETDARTKARKKELAARPEPAGKVYDLTLKLADEPGLPAPTVRTNTTASVTNAVKGVKLAKDLSDPNPRAERIGPPPTLTLDQADPEDIADADVPAVDPTLDETRRILVDYIQLLSGKNGVTAIKRANN